MGLFNMLGAYFLIPATIFLTISFFVIFTIGKVTSKELKNFGYVIVALLWICALLAFSAGIFVITTPCRPWQDMGRAPRHHKMMHICPMPDRMPMHEKMQKPAAQDKTQITATMEGKAEKTRPVEHKKIHKKIIIKRFVPPAKKPADKK